jgi:hypothetical protein
LKVVARNSGRSLKTKLGAVTEVEAANQVEAWKKYEQVVNEKGEQV